MWLTTNSPASRILVKRTRETNLDSTVSYTASSVPDVALSAIKKMENNDFTRDL